MRRRRLPLNVTSYVDRHGKERFRFRKTGYPVHNFKGHPGTETKPSEEYLQCLARVANEPRAAPGTIDDLLTRYYRSSIWEGIGPDTKRVRRGILESFRSKYGDKPVALLNWEHIEAILKNAARKRAEGNRIVGGKEASRSLRKQLVRLFDFAIKCEMIATNPVRLATPVKVGKSKGFHTVTPQEIAQYRTRHPLGTMARLALEILLWTWQRRGDAHMFGPKHLKGGKIHYDQAKTGKSLWLPAAPQLLAAIRAMPVVGTETYIVTGFGKPFSRAGFGNKMREWFDEAGLPQCSAHGVRKGGAAIAAQLGGTNQGLKAVGGWSGDSEVATYTAGVDQEALAEATLRRVIEADLANPEWRDLANLAIRN